MRAHTRFTLRTIASAASAALAIPGFALAIHLVWFGAYPPEGTGSLGHVGAVIAGLIIGCLAVVFATVSIYSGRRAWAIRPSTRPR